MGDFLVEDAQSLGRESVIKEAKKQLYLSGPLIVAGLLEMLIQVISLSFVGHLGELPLSAASMATSFTAVTGLSVLSGVGAAIDTLCGQAYGSEKYHLLGIYLQRAMIITILVSIPLAFIWAFTGEILEAIGQDKEISMAAGLYARCMIPILFADGLLQSHYRCKDTWTGFSREAMHDLSSFIKLAVPSALMICLEFWSFDVLVLLAGFLPNPKLETSVLAICLNIIALTYVIHFGIGASVSTRVSNELGAGRPQSACLAICVAEIIAITEGIIVGSTLILGHRIWGKVYSSDSEVVKYIARMMPLLALSNFIDATQSVLLGTIRGCGQQKLGVVVNLGAFYMIGLPCSVVFAFLSHLKAKGLWLGIICGLFTQVLFILITTLSMNWDNEAKKATNRVNNSIIPMETSSTMVDAIGGRDDEKFGRGHIIIEVKKQLWLSGPLVVANLLEKLIQVISLMFVGHLGELPLSGASMATSFVAVTGFSLLLGMGSALDTLCGQAFGAKQYHLLSVYLQRAILILTLVSIPVAFLWAFTGELLRAIGQNKEISMAAELYTRYMIPTLFAYGILQCHYRFLQAQNIVFPMMLCSGITVICHIFICWILVFKCNIGLKGAAIANSLSYWISVALIVIYVRLSTRCKETWLGFSRDALHDVSSFVKLAIPSTLMICLEFWSFEAVVLLSGLLPNPKLETSVLAICLNSSSLAFMIPFGIGASVSTRVSNELGANHPRKAQLAVFVGEVITVSEGVIVGSALIFGRNIWGKLYSNEKEVVDYVKKMMPFVAISNFIDATQSVLTGTARGCGWQKLGAIVNLGAFYAIGIPSSILLAFYFHLKGKAKKAVDRVNDSINIHLSNIASREELRVNDNYGHQFSNQDQE
ncbi:hypothetical protein J5N97_019558 [Dioscorea zingiberensis]|uniref:Protein DETOXIFICATION n=1 Tax=Dioscorea zingiberensis TaxID=325984 RepID=A0A9D5HCL3_9LILI|nr:hypothetical protein J5N97_019558 [Dioscorea zingiberensis]